MGTPGPERGLRDQARGGFEDFGLWAMGLEIAGRFFGRHRGGLLRMLGIGFGSMVLCL